MTKMKQPNYYRDLHRKYRENETPEQKQVRLEKSRERYNNGGRERQQIYLQNKKNTTA